MHQPVVFFDEAGIDSVVPRSNSNEVGKIRQFVQKRHAAVA
jgi:hypothetical protein